MRDHTKLKAFHKADEVTLMIYGMTRQFPKDETYGLISQLRRAAVSTTSNIVEGCARTSQSEYVRFLEIAFGSARELRYQFNLAVRLGYCGGVAAQECEARLLELEKVLCALLRSLHCPKYLQSKPLQPTA